MPEAEFTAPLWAWEARLEDGWAFVQLPDDLSDAIADAVEGQPRRGFGAVKVEVRIGVSVWQTSCFPDAGRRAYVLPVRKAVRTARGLAVGDTVTVHVRTV